MLFRMETQTLMNALNAKNAIQRHFPLPAVALAVKLHQVHKQRNGHDLTYQPCSN